MDVRGKVAVGKAASVGKNAPLFWIGGYFFQFLSRKVFLSIFKIFAACVLLPPTLANTF